MTDDHLDRLRAWRQQLNADHRAWYERNGHPVPEPLHPADEEVPCRLGCGTVLTGPNGEYLPLLLADIDAALDELGKLRAERELLGAGEVQHRIVTPGGLIYPPSERDLANRAHWLPGVRLEQRTIYGTPWEPADPQRAAHKGLEEPA